MGVEGEVLQLGQRRTPPDFMMRLYKSMTDDRGRSSNPAPFYADSVIAFLDESKKCDSVLPYKYFFNITHLPPNTIPTQAELHLYRDIGRDFKRDSNDFKSQFALRRAAKLCSFIFLKLYFVKIDAEGKETLELIEIKRIFRHFYGWMVFNANKILNYWLQSNQNNRGLVLKATNCDGTPIKERDDVDVIQPNNPNARRLQPSLIVYCRTWPPRKSRSNAVQSKDNGIAAEDVVLNDPWHYNRLYMQDYPQSKPTSTPQFLKRSKRNNVHLKRSRQRQCRRRKMIIDFSKLNMTDWILAPVTIDAGVCVGTCAFPLGKESNPTNHAVIQSVWSRYLQSIGSAGLTSVDTQKARVLTPPPLPCCVPHELDDLPMLFFQADNQVVLNHRPDMIVRSCGCR
ncbi:unnamed protein product [Rodentolepis nana]|uniref:TGF_BETA_2 domain-containing protein n=1 Tax=Rodentolepis nana TaxID=102285 RepID=A0A0R3TLS7_RODNA|nr:unnamed protein product [Rodentolepis nana]